MENQETNIPNKPYKRKKKRSANQMAKKQARRREHTNRAFEGVLDEETFDYMINVMDLIRTKLSTMDDKEIFITNVFEQTVDREVEICKNQVGSRVVDSLLRYAPFETVMRFAEAFNDVLRPCCSNKFASHVIQKLISVCAHRANLNELDEEEIVKVTVKESEVQKYNEIALKLCKYAINNIEEFIWDTYANHVLRTSLECLSGLIDLSSDNNQQKSAPDLKARRKVRDEYRSLLITTCKRIQNFPQFQEFNHDPLTAALTQSVLYSLKDIDSELCNDIILKICTECFTESDEKGLSDIFGNECSMRLLETCLNVSNEENVTNMYKKYFIKHLDELSLMKCANFCVQRLFENCKSKEDLETMFAEITEHFGAILELGFTGVFPSVANACRRLRFRQGAFITVMTEVLHCDDSEEKELEIVPLVAKLIKYEKHMEIENSILMKPRFIVTLHGSLTVQAMLKFNKPIRVVNSLLAMSPPNLAEMFEDPKGSRILDAFFDSEFIGEKSREKLFRNLQGHWDKLVCTSHGSRCLDRVWIWAKLPQRIILLKELRAMGPKLYNTKFGRLISSKYNLPLFGRNEKEWEESQGKQEKAKALFADITSTKKRSV